MYTTINTTTPWKYYWLNKSTLVPEQHPGNIMLPFPSGGEEPGIVDAQRPYHASR